MKKPQAPGKKGVNDFFSQRAISLAQKLLGYIVIHETPEGLTSGRIVETEAYLGAEDPASHAFRGPTRRNQVMFGQGGLAYVYFIYGMYWCFNAVTRARGSPSAVLVRAIEPVEGIDLMRRRRPHARRERDLTNGPGKLCLALGIDGSMNRQSLQRGSLVIREYESFDDSAVAITPRIGIRHAADWPLRWLVRDNEFVSKG